MRISDWSSDVCSSDLGDAAKHGGAAARLKVFLLLQPRLAEMNLRVDRAWKDDKTAAVDDFACIARCADRGDFAVPHADAGDRKSVVQGKSVVVMVNSGVRRINKKNKK